MRKKGKGSGPQADKEGMENGTITIDLGKALRAESRRSNRMPQGGRHGTPKGKKGYKRNPKHRKGH
jgi:hypothetical protein